MERIIYTHCDFDGAASAAIVSYVTGILKYKFATPENIFKQGVSGQDVVCDLPYISGCGLWFDHHQSNIQEIIDRGLKPGGLAGSAKAAASAAQVIYEYYQDKGLPSYFEELVKGANIVDTMNYESLEAWLAGTPHNIINETININSESYPAMCYHLDWLTKQLRERSVSEIADDIRIRERYTKKLANRKKDIEFLQKITSFLPVDEGRQIAVIDCSNLAFAPKFNKTLALVVYPQVDYILLIASDFAWGRRTNNLKISLAKNFLKPSRLELGEFLEKLNLGGGHANAAGGIIRANSKKERLKKLEQFTDKFYSLISRAED